MIEWRDKRGRLNVFIDEPLTFPPIEPLPMHPYEPHRYMNGREIVVSPKCWCSADRAHPIHEETDGADISEPRRDGR